MASGQPLNILLSPEEYAGKNAQKIGEDELSKRRRNTCGLFMVLGRGGLPEGFKFLEELMEYKDALRNKIRPRTRKQSKD